MLKKNRRMLVLIILNTILIFLPMSFAIPGKNSDSIKILIYEKYMFLIVFFEVFFLSTSFLISYNKKRILLIISIVFLATNILFSLWMAKGSL